MNNNEFVIIDIDDEGIETRLDHYLTQMFPDISRSKIQKHIKDGNVLVNNEEVKTGYILKEDDILSMKPLEIVQVIENIEPVNLNLEIVYEDEHIAVINKPKDLVVHPAPSHQGVTLVHGLLYQIDNLSSINGKNRPGILHRIDKDTTGLLVIAKTNEAHQILAEDISKHLVKRHYYAIVYGTFSESKGTINMPIARDKSNRLKMSVDPEGRPSTTHFNVLEEYLNHTLLEIELETGRTHQIRVHLSKINHPILGDPMYGPKKIFGDTGQYLHAYKLILTHPITKKEMTFETPFPEYFKEVISQLV